MLYNENGLMENLFASTDRISGASSRKGGISIFETLEDYVEEHVGFADLVLSNFRFIFIYYALICSLVFLTFCVHHLVNFVKKRASILLRPLKNWLTQLARKVRRRIRRPIRCPNSRPIGLALSRRFPFTRP